MIRKKNQQNQLSFKINRNELKNIAYCCSNEEQTIVPQELRKYLYSISSHVSYLIDAYSNQKQQKHELSREDMLCDSLTNGIIHSIVEKQLHHLVQKINTNIDSLDKKIVKLSEDQKWLKISEQQNDILFQGRIDQVKYEIQNKINQLQSNFILQKQQTERYFNKLNQQVNSLRIKLYQINQKIEQIKKQRQNKKDSQVLLKSQQSQINNYQILSNNSEKDSESRLQIQINKVYRQIKLLSKDNLDLKQIIRDNQKRLQQALKLKDKTQVQQQISNKQSQPIQLIDWIDKECKYYKSLQIIKNQLTNKNATQYVYVFGKKPIKQKYSFTVAINRMQHHIGLGVVQKQFKMDSGSINRVIYWSKSGCDLGETRNNNQGFGFKCKEKVRINVDLISGRIQWKVGSTNRHQAQFDPLKNTSLSWVPYIYLGDKLDCVTLFQDV